jgi:hypothetical protein
MGNGEVIGNGSVHWTIQHDDSPGGKRLVARAEGNIEHDVLGNDEVNVYDGARGCDPIPVANVGEGKGHRGKFRVKLRFKVLKDAQDALGQALKSIGNEAGLFVVEIDVPVYTPPRSKSDVRNGRPPAEVRIDW